MNYDPFKHADIYESEWDLFLHEYAKSLEDIKECFRQKLITKEELREGFKYFREKERKEKNDTKCSNYN